MEKKTVSIVAVFIFFFLACILSLLYRLWLPYSYIIFSAVLSALSILTIFKVGKGKNEIVALFFILLLFVLFRIVFNISSGFSFVPLADGYADYSITRIVTESGYSRIIGPDTGYISLQAPSQWPLIQIFAASFSEVTGLSVLDTVLILPLVFSLTLFGVVFLFVRKIAEYFTIDNRFVLLSMLIYAISPDNIETQMQFVRQNLANVFFFVLIYFLFFKVMTRRSVSKSIEKILIIFFGLVLVMTHHFTPFTLILLCICFFFLSYVAYPFIKKQNANWSRLRFPISFVIIMLVALVAWWTLYALNIWTDQGWVLNRVFNFRIEIFDYTLTSAQIRWTFYDNLTLQPFLALMNIRDIAIYGSAIVAFMLFGIRIYHSKKKTPIDRYLTFLSISFIIILIFYEFVLGLQPIRLLWLASPLIALFSASFYNFIFQRRKKILDVLVVLFLAILVSITAIAPWTHLYTPFYLYDPTIRFEDAGSHNILHNYSGDFADQYLDYSSFQTILSDDHFLMYQILPTNHYNRIQNLHLNPDIVYNSTNSFAIFEFLHLNPSFSNLNLISNEQGDVLTNLSDFKHYIVSTNNMIYDNYYSKIYVNNP